MEGSINLGVIFINWYYGEAFRRVWKYILAFQTLNFDVFSVRVLLKTLFSPWKRDIISYEGLTIQQRFQVWTLNLSSRLIGFMVKSMVLLVYLFSELITLAVSAIALVVWPLLPILAIYSIFFGFKLILF